MLSVNHVLFMQNGLQVKLDQGQMLLTVDGVAIANAISRLNGYVFGNGPVSDSWDSNIIS